MIYNPSGRSSYCATVFEDGSYHRLNFEEIKQILSYKFMNKSILERLLKRVFFYNAIILKLREKLINKD